VLTEIQNKPPEEVLRSLLDSGQIDAIAAYKHEAIARGLPYITLHHFTVSNKPSPSYIFQLFNQSSYINHSNQTISAHPIYFSYTIPTTVRNMDNATSFTNFLISPQGKAVLSQVGLNPINAIIERYQILAFWYLSDVIRGIRIVFWL
jgi:molybdate/tungstate transport system substrate-binding protein